MEALLFTYILYLCYIISISALNVWDKLALGIKVILSPVIITGVIMDFMFQVAVSPFFWDIPREWLFTLRMNRYIKQGNTKRGRVARWVCKYFLDPFQVGGHCRYGNK